LFLSFSFQISHFCEIWSNQLKKGNYLFLFLPNP
jgi:hypothetical protein